GFKGPRGPVVLVIMDGVGIGKYEEGDAVRSALTVHLDWLKKNALSGQLKAHGIAVGLPSDEDMGNSEVGHNAMGCGRVFAQGAKLVNKAIESGRIFKDAAWREVVDNVLTANSTLHFMGLLSDGNVHSHIDHLKGMLRQARSEGVKKCRIHVLLDGRDVPETSALDYVDSLEQFLSELNGAGEIDCRIASGGGRMKVTMDRYEANWDIVRLGWDTHVLGKGRLFSSARDAIESYRREMPGVIDQDLPAFVIGPDGKPCGTIEDGDSVVFFNFRGDRAMEISKAFDNEQLDEFDRGPRRKVTYAGMMQYDGDLLIPPRYLVSPPALDRTVGEYLSLAHVKQLAISETQKFGHVTYFFNGNRSGKFSEEFEEYVEIPSDIIPFEQRPWMKAAEITDYVVGAIEGPKARFIRLNFPNGDMVGHTGIYQAAQIAVETVDLCLGRIIEAVRKADGILVVTADHGNADDMFERDKKTGKAVLDPTSGRKCAKTAHSLNPVPIYVYDPSGSAGLSLSKEQNLGISSIAATCLVLLGFEPPADYTPAAVTVAAAD
ncbi:MAG: 2,3-bisphosphoglycerate-independent phosphoglycerate mutase, partial [Lentisphaerales bacterium]